MEWDTSECDVCIVGGGPAGLEAASASARHGARVTLVDDREALGGQIWRPRARHVVPVHGHREGMELVGRVLSSGARVVLSATVFDCEPGVVHIVREGTVEEIFCQQIIVAAGAADSPFPVTGWTLPGVITAGGLHSLVFGQGVVPAGRVVIVGSGPLLLAFGAELAGAGVDIVMIAEAAGSPSFQSVARLVRRSVVMPDLLSRALMYRRELQRKRVPQQHGLVLREIEGDDHVQGVVLSECSPDWRPIVGRDQRIAAEIVCIGYGMSPSDELLRRIGCQLHEDPARGGLVPIRTATLETDVTSVFAVGDGAGVRGVETARVEGRIAGFAAVHESYPAPNDEARLKSLLGQHRRLIRLRGAIDDIYPIGEVSTALSDGTVVCRCEAIATERVVRAVEELDHDIDAVKGITRAGMGRCQGRNCGMAIRRLVGAANRDASPGFRARLPVRPVRVGDIAEMTDYVEPESFVLDLDQVQPASGI